MVIYKTTNLVNGKQYIGKDTRNRRSYLGSGSALKNAIKKYGKENFKKEILEVCTNKDELIEREEYWLNYYDAANNPNFYNLHNFSTGFLPGDKHYFYGKPLSEEFKRKLSQSMIGDKNHFFGKKHSEESLEKIRNARKKQVIVMTDETKRKIGESRRGSKHPLYGKIPSEKTRQKISKSNTGKTHSEQTKQKLQEMNLGDKNPMYGIRGELSSGFRGYILCVDGQYKGQRKTNREWCELLGVMRQNFRKHLIGQSYKRGIRGNFFKWEDEI